MCQQCLARWAGLGWAVYLLIWHHSSHGPPSTAMWGALVVVGGCKAHKTEYPGRTRNPALALSCMHPHHLLPPVHCQLHPCPSSAVGPFQATLPPPYLEPLLKHLRVRLVLQPQRGQGVDVQLPQILLVLPAYAGHKLKAVTLLRVVILLIVLPCLLPAAALRRLPCYRNLTLRIRESSCSCARLPPAAAVRCQWKMSRLLGGPRW